MKKKLIITIGNDSIEDFFKEYCKEPYGSGGPKFQYDINIRKDSLKENTLVYFEVKEYGNVTYADMITTLVYKVRKYDYMCDKLVRVESY
jgi:hypothetical protein